MLSGALELEPVQDFARRHNAHHKMVTCNYGITIDLWDRVFGTYRANP